MTSSPLSAQNSISPGTLEGERPGSGNEEYQSTTSFTGHPCHISGFKARMAPRVSHRGNGRAASCPRREADMSAVINAAQKNELLLLMTSISEDMLQRIIQIFDQPPATSITSTHLNIISNPEQKKAGPGPMEKAKLPGPSSSNIGTATSIACTAGEDGPDDAGGVQVELKKEALASFKKWQNSLIKRASDITAVKYPPSKPDNKLPARPSGRWTEKNDASPGTASTVSLTAITNTTSQPVHGPTLMQLSTEKRQLLLHSMLLLVVSLESYPTYSREFIIRLASHFRLPHRVVVEDEIRLAKGLSIAATAMFSTINLQKKAEEPRKDRRRFNPVTSATSTTLAPSLKTERIGNIGKGVGLSLSATASVLGVMGTRADGGLATCIFFGLCGPRGSPLRTLDAYTKDMQDIVLLPLYGNKGTEIRGGNDVSPENRRLRLCIGISGWLLEGDSTTHPWQVLGDKSESYALGWEHETLAKIGSALDTVAASASWQSAKKEFVNRNVFNSLKTFNWPVSLMKISKIVDNPWSVGMVRADKAGLALADAITNKVLGERAVSLLGYGLGARAIYTCLMSLSERRVFGLVENVVMMGTPAPSDSVVWTALRSAVTGRVINVFAENDVMLGFLHRTSCVQFGVAGLQRIQNVYGIENVDATKPVTSHMRYAHLVGRILRDVGWDDLNWNEIAKVEDALAHVEKQHDHGDKTADKLPDKTTRGGRRRGNTKKKQEAQMHAFKASN